MPFKISVLSVLFMLDFGIQSLIYASWLLHRCQKENMANLIYSKVSGSKNKMELF